MAPHTAKNKGAFAFADFYNENANPLLVQLSFDNFAINWWETDTPAFSFILDSSNIVIIWWTAKGALDKEVDLNNGKIK